MGGKGTSRKETRGQPICSRKKVGRSNRRPIHKLLGLFLFRLLTRMGRRAMLRGTILFFLAGIVSGDVYLHGSIRGSNNRNCRNDNNQARRNANRLFDSQNNNNGGYSCPRAYPFTKGDNERCQGN